MSGRVVMCQPGLLTSAGSSRASACRLPAPLDCAAFYVRGSAALEAGVRAMGLQPGDVVLVPEYHCGIEVDVLVRCGLTVEFYELPSSLVVDPDRIHPTALAKARALYVIHYFGVPQPMEALRNFARHHGLVLVEDCAQALYARAVTGPVGSFGDVAIFSLRKFLALPCGGALVLNRDGFSPMPPRRAPFGQVVRGVRRLVRRDVVGIPVLGATFVAAERTMRGVESRPDSGGIPDIEYREAWRDMGMSAVSQWLFRRAIHERVAERRRQNYRSLARSLAGHPALAPLVPDLPGGACPPVFPVLVEGDTDLFLNACRRRGVWADRHWQHVHAAFPAGVFPHAARLKRQVAVLPVHHGLSEADLDAITATTRAWTGTGTEAAVGAVAA